MASGDTILFLMRHGQTNSNIEGIWPLDDDPLSVGGIAQAKNTSRIVKDIFPEVVISSDSKRASQTAQIVCEGWFGHKILYDPRFKEIDRDNENISKFTDRVKDSVSYVKNNFVGVKTLVVTHTGFIRVFFETSNIPVFEDEEYLKNCSIAGFRLTQQRWELIFRFNAQSNYLWQSEDYKLMK